MPTSLESLEDVAVGALAEGVWAFTDVLPSPLAAPLPAPVGNKLLRTLKRDRRLDDRTLAFFQPETVTLTQVYLSMMFGISFFD